MICILIYSPEGLCVAEQPIESVIAREGKWVEWLADADQVVHLRPDWPKAPVKNI
jgi:hypothetical protein